MKNTNIINLVILVFLIVFLENIDLEYSILTVFISITICLFQFVLIMRSGYNYYVRPIFIFLLSFFIVNCQIYLDLLLGFLTPEYKGFINSNTINIGSILSAIAFTSLGLGYNTIKSKSISFRSNFIYSESLFKVIKTFNYFSFLLWMSQLTIADFTGESYINSGAHDVTKTNYTDVLFSMSQILCYSYLAKHIKNQINIKKIHKEIPKYILICSIFYVLVKLMSGDRGGAIFISLMLLFFVIFVTKIKFKLIILVPIITLAALIMTSISMSRLMGNELSFTDKISYVFKNTELLEENKSFLSPTRELANSNICTHIAIDEIQNKHKDYHYGEFHICYILNCIPFISNFIIKELGISRVDASSSEYITVAYSGTYYMSGLGTSTIADNYLEFGVFGVIVSLFIIGVLLKIVDNVIINSYVKNLPMILIIFTLTMCYSLLTIPRAYFLFYIRLFIYVYVLYKIFEVIILRRFLK